MGSRRDRTRRIITCGRVAIIVVVLLVLALAAVFAVRTRDDLRDARNGLSRSQQHLARLDGAERDAVVARADAFAALERARELLRADTAARDELRATDRIELLRLAASLQTLSEQQVALAAGTARAKLLDDCLTGASQVLNEAAVGDVAHLASTLPPVQRRCAQATA